MEYANEIKPKIPNINPNNLVFILFLISSINNNLANDKNITTGAYNLIKLWCHVKAHSQLFLSFSKTYLRISEFAATEIKTPYIYNIY